MLLEFRDAARRSGNLPQSTVFDRSQGSFEYANHLVKSSLGAVLVVLNV